ncbi:MAG: GNAT family N-acetyltransferase [Pseudomonadota bacterium]
MSSSGFTIDTPRLHLREFSAEDADDLFRLNSDPEVMRYTGDSTFTDPASARYFLRHYDHYERDGFGRWAVTDRETGAFMGFCGLRREADSGEVNLGFRFFRSYWAAGYATEAARACLEAGFRRFGLEEIIGRVMRENLPSITILQKLGMKYRDMTEDDGEFWLVYTVNAERFLKEYLHR